MLARALKCEVQNQYPSRVKGTGRCVEAWYKGVVPALTQASWNLGHGEEGARQKPSIERSLALLCGQESGVSQQTISRYSMKFRHEYVRFEGYDVGYMRFQRLIYKGFRMNSDRLRPKTIAFGNAI